MKRSTRGTLAPLLVLACATAGVLAGSKAFSINDDILAFPQFQVEYPDEFILESDARALLETQDSAFTSSDGQGEKDKQVRLAKAQKGEDSDASSGSHDEFVGTYERMILQGHPYLCQIPHVETENTTSNKDARNKEEEEKELARATDRGLELLREMEGRCMYYVSGWWSYSFCYKNQVKQFHALPSGMGVPSYPPVEDPTTHSFVLGRFGQGDEEDDEPIEDKKTTTDVAELQTKGESRYLVQRLGGGTKCDLTGKERKIEIQFHCHPQSTDRIGWIKELTTCSYLMIIYTPRLCHDVAFLPPQHDDVHLIECREIITADEIADWERARAHRLAQKLVEAASAEFPVVGGIEVGAQKMVGTEGKEIQKGRVATAGEERVEVVAKKEGGEVQLLSKEELKKFDLDPEKIELLKKRLEELAKGKDWKLEVIEVNGGREIRGILDSDDDEDEFEYESAEDTKKADDSTKQQDKKEDGKPEPETAQKKPLKEKMKRPPYQPPPPEPTNDESDEGSEETFKEEL
ncbi:Protein OS-9 [Paecilomyces lecythidis]